jgi:hypothetical protein
MKTIHALFAATLLLAPFAVHAQSAGASTTTDGTASGTAQGTDTTAGDVGAAGTGTLDSDVGAAGTGTLDSDVGTAGTGTSGSDVGTGGTGTLGNDVGSSGSGTTLDGTTSSAPVQPVISLQAASTTLRTPGTMQVTVALAADARMSPAQASDIEVPLASSNGACTLPASVTVAWTSASGGSATVDVTCGKARPGTVTVSSGDASTAFTVK